MKRFLLPLILAFLVIPAWGEFYYQDDPEVLTLIHLSRRMGKVLPFSSFPVHGSDLLDFADSLYFSKAEKSINETDRDMLEDLILKLEKQKEGEILIKGGLAAAYEHRFSTGAFMLGEEDLPDAIDVHRAYLDFSPVLSLNAAAGTFNGLYVGGQIDIRPKWTDNFSPMNNFLTGFSFAYDMVKRGILAWNGNYINLFFGRDTVHWGNPEGSSLYPSALLPHLDRLSMNVPLGPFSFDYMLASIMPKRSDGKDVDDVVTPKPGEPPLGPYFGFMKENDKGNPSIILMAAHRFQWNFGMVKAGIGGTIVYARPNNQFTITDFLPIIIYHNSDSVPNNLAMIVDAEWTIIPGLSLSAMFGVDDINGNKIGIPDDEVPTIPGALLQLHYSAASPNLFQSYMFEAGYTHYLWGNFEWDDNYSNWYGVYLARAIYRWTIDKSAVLLPLTSPYGPGALWGKFNANFEIPKYNIQTGAELLFLLKNSKVNLIDTPYKTDDGLNSFDMWYFSIDLPFYWTWRFLKFTFSPALLFSSEGNAFECTLGVRYTLEGSRFFSTHRRK